MTKSLRNLNENLSHYATSFVFVSSEIHTWIPNKLGDLDLEGGKERKGEKEREKELDHLIKHNLIHWDYRPFLPRDRRVSSFSSESDLLTSSCLFPSPRLNLALPPPATFYYTSQEAYPRGGIHVVGLDDQIFFFSFFDTN